MHQGQGIYTLSQLAEHRNVSEESYSRVRRCQIEYQFKKNIFHRHRLMIWQNYRMGLPMQLRVKTIPEGLYP